MSRRGQVSASVLLVIVGMWLLLQTIVGDLPGRLLSWRAYARPTNGATPPRWPVNDVYDGGGSGTTAPQHV